ncbi:MAG: aspartyl-phosphate phosphatase Spo0E family protein [Bacillus sp. (in: Bacteria)]|nr:aspartyl-phosphate phosphatase Spo0E family protein [Bacillus sp. (in: firmicutes)]
MDIGINSLLSDIEKTRMEMIHLAHQFGYSNLSVVRCSQRLDFLLNEYSSKHRN